MSQTTARKPKLELAVNRKETITLLSQEPYFDVGQYGTWALISVEHEGEERTWFPPYHVAIYLKNNCGLGDLLTICKLQEAGERSTTWLINEIEVPFVRDPKRVENGSGNGQQPEIIKQVSQPVERKHVQINNEPARIRESSKSTSASQNRENERLKLEALRAAIEYAKTTHANESLNPEQVVEAARAFQGFLKEG